MAEVREGANHAHGLLIRQGFEQLLQITLSLRIRMPAVCHREFAHFFHDVINGCAILLANHIAQNSAEQANVFD